MAPRPAVIAPAVLYGNPSRGSDDVVTELALSAREASLACVMRILRLYAFRFETGNSPIGRLIDAAKRAQTRGASDRYRCQKFLAGGRCGFIRAKRWRDPGRC